MIQVIGAIIPPTTRQLLQVGKSCKRTMGLLECREVRSGIFGKASTSHRVKCVHPKCPPDKVRYVTTAVTPTDCTNKNSLYFRIGKTRESLTL